MTVGLVQEVTTQVVVVAQVVQVVTVFQEVHYQMLMVVTEYRTILQELTTFGLEVALAVDTLHGVVVEDVEAVAVALQQVVVLVLAILLVLTPPLMVLTVH
jgi:hypothetical protein